MLVRPKNLILTFAIVVAPVAIAHQEQVARLGIKKVQIPMTGLRRSATISLQGAPDWLAISDDAVWVANSKFKAVQRIDPKTNSAIAKVEFSDEPCSGLTFAFGTLWVPLCGKPASLARVDPRTNKIVAILPFGPADSEGGIAASGNAIWLIADANGTLLRIDCKQILCGKRFLFRRALPIRFTATVSSGSPATNPTFSPL
jgi:DNA-binding beta-propeller fold protein YncE